MAEIKAWQSDEPLKGGSPIFGSMAEIDWCVLDAKTKRLSCQRCGDSEEAPMGLLLQQFADILNGFIRRHAECQPGT